MIVLKTRACGPSCQTLRVIDAIAPTENSKDALFLDEVAGALLGSENFAMNVGKCASVQLFEDERRNFAEPFCSLVVAERKADVVDLPAAINALRVGNKKDAGDRQGLGSNIEKRTVGLFPHGVKLCLDKNPGPLPHRPAENTLAPKGSRLTLDQRETLVGWCSRQWPALNVNGSAIGNHGSAEPENVGLYELGRAHAVLEQSNDNHQRRAALSRVRWMVLLATCIYLLLDNKENSLQSSLMIYSPI